MLHNGVEKHFKVTPLTDYELGLIENQSHGLKSTGHLLLMKKTEYEVFIKTGRSPDYKPGPKRKKMKLVTGTKFLLAADEDGREFALIGNEYVPIDSLKKHKDYIEE